MSDFINAEIRIDRFNSLIRALKKRSKNLKPVMSVIGNLVVKSVRQNFREEGRPDKWQQSRKPKGRTLLGTGDFLFESSLIAMALTFAQTSSLIGWLSFL